MKADTQKRKLRHRTLRLLKKGQKGLVHAIFSRFGLVLVLIALQAVLLLAVFGWIEETRYFWGGNTVLVAVTLLHLYNCSMEGRSKLTWMAIIMSMPVVGSLFFAYTRFDPGHITQKKAMAELKKYVKPYKTQDEDVITALKEADPHAASLAHFIYENGNYPVYGDTEVTYFPLGEDKWQAMLNELEKAEHFIFLEYFIIDEGEMWGSILDVLARKVKMGVDVRVMYDGTCELSTLPPDYPKLLTQLGIKCQMFSPIRPVLSTHYNNRDHRKILVIDGKVGFTGGVNLADEYVNRIVRFGHWKDTAAMIRGKAVDSLTVMFLQMWSLMQHNPAPEIAPYIGLSEAPKTPVPGFVLPYGENPLTKRKIAKYVYLDILNRAQDYVYIMTPYLILDEEMETALRFAAMRGVDIRIILPGIPDKKLPYALAKGHYHSLLQAGVKVFEYTPGFVHAKVFVSDDREAVVGTINLDYRSLMHHFECAVYMNGVSCIGEIRDDFMVTQEKCAAVTKETIEKEKFSMKAMGYIMKVIGPLL